MSGHETPSATQPAQHNRRRVLTWLVGAAAVALAAVWVAQRGLNDMDWAARRRQMVDEQIKDRGIKDERVLKAMHKVPRHEFVPEDYRSAAYQDRPLPIGLGQTISQPYIVALMTEAVTPKAGQRVLEVGAGSGYQAAVLAELGTEVYTIELLAKLAEQAQENLKRVGYKKVKVKAGDGYLGWPDAAPFDAIVVTCGAEHVPAPLFEQLKPGGKMVIPVGKTPDQVLYLITKGPNGERQERELAPVRFVPLRRAADVKDK
ncbi:MAG: protein-L-isoaspartate(D-aspartate) O-methyltransferase [Gemmataceae bacterium]|nr:protein-L-isoaspartate(D-aspartate) O-methyltransferase [Gemmataceae bacterium]